MKIVLLRVGIDSGSGGAQSPLFKDGSFEFIPIPDDPNRLGNKFTKNYSNTKGRTGKKLIQYLPKRKQKTLCNTPLHNDPEFKTFTYGDPSILKSRLRNLKTGDLLVFYAGLEGFGFKSLPALYIISYFEVEKAGRVWDFTEKELKKYFKNNIHIYNAKRFKSDKNSLVLVKGSGKSRLLKKAILISDIGKDKSGKDIKVLSKKAQRIFGDFNGKISIQRSAPRWVSEKFIQKADNFIKSLK